MKLKNLLSFEDFLNESFPPTRIDEIKVNKNAKDSIIDELVKDVRQQIIDAGNRGQEYVTVNFYSDEYSDGWLVMDKLEDLVEIQERGFGSQRINNRYKFYVSCKIINKRIINTKALDIAINTAIKSALEQATKAANKGQTFVTINFELPTLDTTKISDALSAEGVNIIERGAKSEKNDDGSWSFTWRCKIDE